MYTGKELYLFSAVTATLKGLTDKGFQRLRIPHLCVMVLLPPPQEGAVWEMLHAVDIDKLPQTHNLHVDPSILVN